MLVADDRGQKHGIVVFLRLRTAGKPVQAIEAGELVGRIHFNRRWRKFGIVQRADSNVQAAFIFIGQRRAAPFAKATSDNVRALEMPGRAARPTTSTLTTIRPNGQQKADHDR